MAKQPRQFPKISNRTFSTAYNAARDARDYRLRRSGQQPGDPIDQQPVDEAPPE